MYDQYSFMWKYSEARASAGFGKSVASGNEALRFWQYVDGLALDKDAQQAMLEWALEVAGSTDQPLTNNDLATKELPVNEGLYDSEEMVIEPSEDFSKPLKLEDPIMPIMEPSASTTLDEDFTLPEAKTENPMSETARYLAKRIAVMTYDELIDFVEDQPSNLPVKEWAEWAREKAKV